MIYHFIRALALLTCLVSTARPAASGGASEYLIEIRVSKCGLRLFAKAPDGERRLVATYSVATAKRGLTPVPLGRGTITKIEFDPWWYPTPYSRQFFREEKGIDLPARVPPGHPLNYMGSFKMHLSHRTAKGDIYRIHGNNDASLVGKRVTGGCIRMHNSEGKDLAKRISVGTEVIILP